MGVERNALGATLQTIQADYEGTKLKGIEEKDEGFVVVTLSVPEGSNKAEIEYQFKQIYQGHIKAIEQRYKAELQATREQIDIYRTQNAQITEIAKQLAKGQPNPVTSSAQVGKLVVLTLGEGDFFRWLSCNCFAP